MIFTEFLEQTQEIDLLIGVNSALRGLGEEPLPEIVVNQLSRHTGFFDDFPDTHGFLYRCEAMEGIFPGRAPPGHFV